MRLFPLIKYLMLFVLQAFHSSDGNELILSSYSGFFIQDILAQKKIISKAQATVHSHRIKIIFYQEKRLLSIYEFDENTTTQIFLRNHKY
jgi:hypothetical protein